MMNEWMNMIMVKNDYFGNLEKRQVRGMWRASEETSQRWWDGNKVIDVSPTSEHSNTACLFTWQLHIFHSRAHKKGRKKKLPFIVFVDFHYSITYLLSPKKFQPSNSGPKKLRYIMTSWWGWMVFYDLQILFTLQFIWLSSTHHPTEKPHINVTPQHHTCPTSTLPQSSLPSTILAGRESSHKWPRHPPSCPQVGSQGAGSTSICNQIHISPILFYYSQNYLHPSNLLHKLIHLKIVFLDYQNCLPTLIWFPLWPILFYMKQHRKFAYYHFMPEIHRLLLNFSRALPLHNSHYHSAGVLHAHLEAQYWVITSFSALSGLLNPIKRKRKRKQILSSSFKIFLCLMFSGKVQSP